MSSDGLYDKYEVRKDGETIEDCFVLEPENDVAALKALEAYERNCDDRDLREDLREWISAIHRRSGDRR